MKRIMAGLLSAILLISTWALAEDEAAPAQPQAGKSIALVGVGSVDTALVERVAAFARENTILNLRVLSAMEVTGDTLDAIAVAAAKAMEPDDAMLVVLADTSADIKPHGVSLPDIRVTVVNVKSLKPASGDAETLARRVEREVMQGIGMQLGMPACPNPQCAMWSYSTDEELDAKGRNYCPPCMQTMQSGAREKGIGVDINNPWVVQ
jgi:predicted Zn-dependent protease